MSCRDLTILGTASQAPTRERNHGGYLIRWDGEGILVDPGEGTQRQFIFAGVAPTTVTRILLTHFHGDHCLGLAAMLQRLSLDGVAHEVHCHFPASGLEYVERMRHASIYYDRLSLVLHPIPAEGGPVAATPAFRIEALPLQHPVDTLGYRFEEPAGRRFDPEALARLGVAGPLVGDLSRDGSVVVDGRTVTLDEATHPHPGQTLAVVLDTRPCANGLALARDADLLLVEATFLDDAADRACEYGHMTMSEAATLAREAGARRVVFTHFSGRYPDAAVLQAEADRLFPGAVVAADLQRIVFGPLPRSEKKSGSLQ